MQTTSTKMAIGALLLVSFICGCATLPKDFERPASYTITDKKATVLGKTIALDISRHEGLSGFHLLGNGLGAFVARAVLAGLAERSIDVQYYLYYDDLVGRLFS